jgi:hypothetical protein
MQRSLLKSLAPPLPRSLSGSDDFASSGGVAEPLTRDGPQNVYLPTCPEHLPLVASGIPLPDWMWTFQEASGDFFDRCNNPAGVLVAGTNTLYQQSIAGWTSKFFRINAEGVGGGARAPISSLWNIGNQSLFVLLYSAVLSSGGNRCLFLGGGANGLQIEIVAAGQATCFCNSVRVAGSFVYESATATVHPFALSYDRRGAGLVRVHTEKEEITSTWANLSDNVKGLGSNNISPPVSMFNLLVPWVGVDAEAMIDRGGAGLGGKQLITDLGWPMAY